VRLPLGAAVTLEFLGPLTLAVVLSRRPVEVLWVLLAGVGIVLLGRGELGGLDPVGALLAVTAGALWAAYIMLSGATGRRWEGLDGLAAASIVAGLAVAPLGLWGAGTALLHRDVLLVGLAVALLSSVLPYAFELVALRRLSARTFGVLMSLEPAAAALAGLTLLGQRLAVAQVVGIALVAAASAGATLGARYRVPLPPGG
jgi:inner membrane transporter RhtA